MVARWLRLFHGRELANSNPWSRASRACSLVASWLVPVPLSQAATLVGGELAAHHESSLILAHSHAGMQAGGFVPANSTNSANLLDQAL